MDAGVWLEQHTTPDLAHSPRDKPQCDRCGNPKEPDRAELVFCAACAGEIWKATTKKQKEPDMHMDWTPPEDALLKQHCSKGQKACAEIIGRSPSAVQQRASKLGLSLKKPVDTTKRECPHCHGMFFPAGYNTHVAACERHAAHGLARNAETSKLEKVEPVGQGVDTKLDETVFAPVTHLGRHLDAVQLESPIAESAEPVEHPGHSVKETAAEPPVMCISDDPLARGGFFTAVSAMNAELHALRSAPAHRWDLYCMYCHHYQNGECWIPKRDRITGEWELDIMIPFDRKELGTCDPQRTLLGHVRSLLGLEVG